jgi:hypothetical protein
MLGHNFGTDPEAFVYKNLVKTEFGLIPDIIPPAALIEDMNFLVQMKKGKKVLLNGNIDGKYFQWSEDGAAIEMQVSPQNTEKDFIDVVQGGLFFLAEWLNNNYGLYLWSRPLGYFDLNSYWRGRGESFRDCVRFGCDPDQRPIFYDKLEADAIKEIDVSNHSYRYGGAHIHIQAPIKQPFVYFSVWEDVATILDFFVGTLNASLERTESVFIADMARLKYYGKPGRIRFQTYNDKKNMYGIEYRVLSNHWLDNPTYTRRILNAADFAVSLVENNLNERFMEKFNPIVEDMYHSILNLDRNTAEEILLASLRWALDEGVLSDEKLHRILSGE